MKKSFLLLLLMTLLPFAGWAEQVFIELESYNGTTADDLPSVRVYWLSGEDSKNYLNDENFEVTWTDPNDVDVDLDGDYLPLSEGTYTATVTLQGEAAETYSFSSNESITESTAEFEVSDQEPIDDPVDIDSYSDIVVTVNPTKAGFTGEDIAFPTTVSVKGLLNGEGDPVDVPVDYYSVAWTFGGEAATVANAVGTYTVTVTANADYEQYVTFDADAATFEVVNPEVVDVQVIPVTSATMLYGGEIALTAENANNVFTLSPATYNTSAAKELIVDKLKINEAATLAGENVGDQIDFTLGLKDVTDQTVAFDEFTTLRIMPTGTGKVAILPAQNELIDAEEDALVLATDLTFDNTDQPLIVEYVEPTEQIDQVDQNEQVDPTFVPTAKFGTVKYFASTTVTTVDALPADAAFDEAIPTGKNAGTYYVYALAPAHDAATPNYTASAVKLVGTVVIAKATPTFAGTMTVTGAGDALTGQNVDYRCTYDPALALNGDGVSVVTDPSFTGPVVKYYYSKRSGSGQNTSWSTPAPIVTEDDPETDVNEKTVFGAGRYRIIAYIEADENGNWDAVVGSGDYVKTVQVDKADAVVPTALDLTYNGERQTLISDPQNTAIWFRVGYNGNYSPNLPQRTNAGTYNVQYIVYNDENYNNINGTIPVTIKKSLLTIKVNDVTKVYNGNSNVTRGNSETVEEDGPRFNFLNTVYGTDANALQNVGYAAYAEGEGVNVGTYPLTITKEALTAINANYEYFIEPGTLTVTPKELYVQTWNTNNQLTTTYGYTKDISDAYRIYGLVTGETAADAFGENLPVLTAVDEEGNALNTAEDILEVGSYDVEFVPGTLVTGGNYVMRAENPYVVYTNGTYTDQFIVQPVADSKVMITVVNQTAEYNGGAAPEYTMVPGTNYYVIGLLGDDADDIAAAFTTAPTFTLAEPADAEAGYTVGEYDLTYDENAVLKHADRYPGGIVFINGTMTITPLEVEATVAPQTVLCGAEEDDLDPEAFEIVDAEGNPVDADLLGATIALNADTEVDDLTVYEAGIVLTITNQNYILKGADEDGAVYGTLTVLASDAIILNPDAEAATIIAAVAETGEYDVTLGPDFPKMKANEWYTVVLPFEVNTLDLVTKLQSYVIVNVLGTSDADHVQFVLESDHVQAGEPFLIKCNKEGATFAGVTFEGVEITGAIYSYDDPKYGGNALVGSYAEQEFQSTDDQMLAWLGNSGIMKADGVTPRQNKWYEPYSAAKTIAPFEAYLKYAPGKTAGARLVTFQEADGTITAIGTITNDVDVRVAEGWYTINGMKLNAAPTQKGVYIQNGKKVIIK